MLYDLSRNTRKACPRVMDQFRHKPACEDLEGFTGLYLETREITLSRRRTTKTLIGAHLQRLCYSHVIKGIPMERLKRQELSQ